jgi:2-polyprenyl-3-methyl-5-hydroxy-6-metoxy-1,4-benzoquinol methylase
MSQTTKEYYSTYRADDKLSELNLELIREVLKFDPVHVLELGCGTGKNLAPLNAAGICTIGIDISPMNIYKAIHKYDLPCVICSDETYLRNLCNVDVVFTVSVLDHIENVYDIIEEFKRIANKAVILAETQMNVGDHYFSHLYNSYGFTPTSFQYVGEDGATYGIWIWTKEISVSNNSISLTNERTNGHKTNGH